MSAITCGWLFTSSWKAPSPAARSCTFTYAARRRQRSDAGLMICDPDKVVSRIFTRCNQTTRGDAAAVAVRCAPLSSAAISTLPNGRARYDLPPDQLERYVAGFIVEISSA